MPNMKNLGGTMPDGAHVPDFWINNQADFICESGVMLSQAKDLLGKLCLTRSCLIMLPYDGAVLAIVMKLSDYLKKTILGPYAKMADVMKKFGLYAQGPGIFEKVLIWPIAHLSQDATVKERSLLFIHGGADLIIQMNGQIYTFNMATQGHAPVGFASAQEFMSHINKLRQVLPKS